MVRAWGQGPGYWATISMSEKAKRLGLTSQPKGKAVVGSGVSLPLQPPCPNVVCWVGQASASEVCQACPVPHAFAQHAPSSTRRARGKVVVDGHAGLW